MDPVIKKTEERLEWLSSDEETRRRYEMRENSRIELNSILHELNVAKDKGKNEGEIEVAKEMLRAGMSRETISSLTKLSLHEIDDLADKL